MAGLKWVGGAGQFIPGVPARDLTAEEAERFPRAAESPLYEAADAPKATRKTTAAADAPKQEA